MKNGRYCNFRDICDRNLWDTGYLVKKLQGYEILRPPLMGPHYLFVQHVQVNTCSSSWHVSQPTSFPGLFPPLLLSKRGKSWGQAWCRTRMTCQGFEEREDLSISMTHINLFLENSP